MATNNDILITADSTCDLPEELVKKNGITIIPLSILLGEDEFLDGVDVKPRDIYDYVDKTGILPKTSAVSPTRYYEIFKKAVDEGKSIVHIGLSSAISSSFTNSVIASEEFDNVFCVDSKSLCTAMGLLVLKACDLKNEGLSAKEIANEITALVPKISATFIVNSLEYLHKGGRCSSVAKLGANVLGIKPSIAVDNATGRLEVSKKYRGKLEVVYNQYVLDRLNEASEIDSSRIVIANSGGLDEKALTIAKKSIEEKVGNKEIIYADAGCTISSHCGPKTLAVFYIKK